MARPPLTVPVARAREEELALLARMANRHGLVAGATGTGKTVTLRVLAEGLSRLGVPVFMADVKGDLSGLARPGADAPPVSERVKKLGLSDFAYQAAPVAFWDVFGKQGHPVRATVTALGPLLLARILGLNDVQEGVLQIVFKFADEQGLLLLDLKDLRAVVAEVSDRASELRAKYGNVSTASVGAIQRALLALEAQGGDKLLGEPALELEDLMQTAEDGRGVVNVLAADELIRAPRVYATLLLWMLSELFERLPEVGDPEKPRLVFFFDEAHLLFDDAPKALLDRIEQVVRLVRSKGVGVYFVTQSPLDVPETVLGQLGNRVQHALRAFTPRDQKAVRTAADTFRQRSGLDAAEVITQLGVGEALVSLLDEGGTPTPVDRALVLPPRSRLQPLTPDERAEVVRASPLAAHYGQAVDRESAYEQLRARAGAAQRGEPAPRGRSGGGWGGRAPLPGDAAGAALDMLGSAAKSAARAAGSQLGREIMRGVLGSLFGGGGRRR
ncbi:helicase HerA-like domain-containing protein [Anaeromyxobacter diazotrophicus]|uniref:ATP-binding protein n=1 Tax=Anaeromyxobacter diazotrophicus TaxID=2590199 RepID=A0A7I9VKU8_9BACT|nr:helicase HerA-like domain-containing protein [Anaeromyxobacter diazotrophicus]GEJ57021.1 ATP-binding protein [Anaeromyxobacter diazotrophicus]